MSEDLQQLRALVCALDRAESAAASRARGEVRDAKHLLDRVDDLVRSITRAKAHTPRVHLLAALGRERHEPLHCNLLRWLLDPVETHGYGEGFLAAVLDECGLTVPCGMLADAKAQCEVRGTDSRIDVEISRTGVFLVHIEAKIDHVERERQTTDEAADLERRCVAMNVPPDCAQPIYLTCAGYSPSAATPERVRPWLAFSWQRLATTLRRAVVARRHAQTALVEHVLDVFEMLTTGGAMEPFAPDELDRLLIDNWDKVTRLAEVRDRLEERVRATFTHGAFKGALEGSTFADWELSVYAGNKRDAFYIAPKHWPRDDAANLWTCFGFENVTVETLLASNPEDGPVVCFFWKPLLAKCPAVGEHADHLRALAAKHLPLGVTLDRRTKDQPVQWHPRLDFRSHPERIARLAEMVVEEWQRMEALVPEIDGLIRRAKLR
jgi:hypothetical protein